MQASFVTHIGRRRSNQDNGICDRGRSLFAVADGVGGGLEGEVAAALVAAGVVAWWRKSLIWALSAGMVVLWIVGAIA